MKNNERFVSVFAELGSSNVIDEELFYTLKKVVCHIYGYQRFSSVDRVRKEMVMKNYEKYGKTLDFSTLPPSSSNLYLRAIRANYVARINKRANQINMSLADAKLHRWNDNYEPRWDEKKYPDNLAELLLDEENIVEDSANRLIQYDSTSDESLYSDED